MRRIQIVRNSKRAWPDESSLEAEVRAAWYPRPAMDDAAALSKREAAVESLLRSKRVGDALRDSLADPPVASKDLELKSKNTVIVLKVIAAVDDRHIDEALGELSPEACDVLMKYIYKGLESPEQSSQLLKWLRVRRYEYPLEQELTQTRNHN